MIAEFDDDASHFASAEPEYVPLPTASIPTHLQPGGAGPAFSPPSPAAAAAARKFWLKVLHRFTEPVPGTKGHLRLPRTDPTEEPRILIECAPLVSRGCNGGGSRTWVGREVRVDDKGYLLLFGERVLDRRPGDPDGHLRVAAFSAPVLWTDIINIRFESERVVPARIEP